MITTHYKNQINEKENENYKDTLMAKLLANSSRRS
jgi:hypothetical protein